MSLIYNRFKGRNTIGNAPWSTSTARTYQVMLISSTSFTANADDDTVATALAASESTSTTYGRVTLGTLSVSTDDANDRAVLDAGNATFSAIDTGQVDALAVIENVGGSTSDTGRFPVMFNDSTAAFPFQTNGGDVTIQWSTAGLMTLS